MNKTDFNLQAPTFNVPHILTGLHQIIIKKKKINLKNNEYKVGGEIFCHFLYVHNVFSTKSQITALIKISSLKT